MAGLVAGRFEKGAELIDPTTLKSQADAFLVVLEDAAADAGWSPNRSCVTNGPPAVECDSLFVWADAITPFKDSPGPRCHIVHRVRLQYVVAVCVGVVPCEGSATMHDTAWGVQAGMVQTVLGGGWCDDPCNTVRFGDFSLFTNDGGYSWWQGSVQIDLSPEELFS